MFLYNLYWHCIYIHSLTISFLKLKHVSFTFIVANIFLISYLRTGQIDCLLFFFEKYSRMSDNSFILIYLSIYLPWFSNCIFRGPVYYDNCFCLMADHPFWKPQAPLYSEKMRRPAGTKFSSMSYLEVWYPIELQCFNGWFSFSDSHRPPLYWQKGRHLCTGL